MAKQHAALMNGIPCENNALESINRYIKEDTDRKRNGLLQFMNNIENNLIHDWSKQTNPNSYDFKDFGQEPCCV